MTMRLDVGRGTRALRGGDAREQVALRCVVRRRCSQRSVSRITPSRMDVRHALSNGTWNRTRRHVVKVWERAGARAGSGVHPAHWKGGG